MNRTQQVEDEDHAAHDRDAEAVGIIRGLLGMGLDDHTFRARVGYLLRRASVTPELLPWRIE